MVNIADEIANGKVPFVVLVIMSLFLVSLAAATGHGAVNITLLPMSTGAAALDGSPYGFFFVKASNPAEKRWTISIEGGGWCVGNADCYERSQQTTHDGKPGSLGSSTPLIGHPAGCGCMNTDTDGLATDCNCIYMPYLDGGSFSGNVSNPVPVEGQPGKFIHYKGMRNLDATIDYALAELGLKEASELVVTGGSAGGLSTFLHLDHIAGRMAAEAPECKRTTGAPVVGFFLDHATYAGSVAYPTSGNYSDWMKIVVADQNVKGALLPECLKAFPDHEHLCFMSPHMARFIQTPFFVFNSRFDAWQMDNDLQIPCKAGSAGHPACNTAEQAAIIQYGTDFLTALTPAIGTGPKNGAFITSCICHSCDWAELVLDNITSNQYYARWHSGTAATTIHIDTRPPNGGGAIKLSTCFAFP